MRAGDAEAFVATFCDEQRQNLESLTDSVLAAKATGGETKIDITEIKIDGDRATATVDATIGGQVNGPEAEVYVKTDGEWKNC